jgi:cysteine-rich repeat protein
MVAASSVVHVNRSGAEMRAKKGGPMKALTGSGRVWWIPLLASALWMGSIAGTARATSLVSGLGGARDYGESTLGPSDDGSSAAIDITSIFGASGLNFFGTSYTSLYVNNNGNLTFAGPLSTFTPFGIAAGSTPIIAAFFADVDTRGTHSPADSNLVYYDLDTVNRVFTATWDLVGYYSGHTDKLNAFQIRLTDRGSGDFDIEFRYAQLQWTTGDFSGGSGGLGGSVAHAGYSAGDHTNFFEFAESGDQAGMLDLVNRTNAADPGDFIFEVRNGTPQICGNGVVEGTEECDDGNTVSGDGCSSTCQIETPGLCGNHTVDMNEQCDEGVANGTSTSCCNADCTFRSAGEVCRQGSGNANGGSVCDPDETCTGSSGSCPNDVITPSGTVCRAGSGNPNGGDVCDPDETCSGSAGDPCPTDTIAPVGTVCRAGSGNPNGGDVCDPDESCSGNAGDSCPTDTIVPAGTVCRAGSGNPNGGAVCDPDESCSGTAGAACPADTVQPSSFVCRPSAGVCDVAENCSGTPGQACAVDAFSPASAVCRPVANDCDVAENCTGGTAACPSDGFKPDGSACNDNNICTETDSCTNGVCAGSPTGADTDGDGYCDLFENQVGCDPNDPQETPPQAATYGGTGANRANVLVTYSGPSGGQVTAVSDKSCTTMGTCGLPPLGFVKGFCTEGRIGDACTTDAQCDLPPGTCRLVVNYADVPDLVLDYAVLNRHSNPIAGFTPVHPGCSRKVDVTLDPSRPVNRVRVKAEGTVDGHHGKDRDTFIYR